MIIDSIELENFKSFGKKTRIKFRPGFTVITGPNGSGKSNLGDAMLFVLGIRSSKSIRVDSLPDLIHQSGNDRNAKYCRVTLNLKFDGDVESVTTLSREIRIDNGSLQSHYFINGSKVRRADIEKFLDTNQLYLDAYSFVLQGDINNLIKMSGTERRKLIESIAGIESYNVKIESSKKEIAGINEHLERSKASRNELKRHVETLHREKEAAEHYLELNHMIKDYEATLLHREIASLEQEIRVYAETKREAEDDVRSYRQQIAALTEKLQDSTNQLEKLKKERESLTEPKLKSLEAEISDKRLERARLELTKDNTAQNISDLKQKIKGLIKALDEERKREEILSREVKQLESDRKNYALQLEQKTKELESLRAERGETTRNLEDIKKKIASNERSIAEMENKVAEQTQTRNEIKLKIEVSRREVAKLSEEEEDARVTRNDARYRLEEVKRENSARKKDLSKLNTRYYDLRNRISELREEKDARESELRKLLAEQQRISALSNRTSHSMHALSVINRASAEGKISGVYGTVSDLIQFDAKYSRAVRSSSGSRLNAVVVSTDEIAEKCLILLKKEKAGRLTFLPLNKLTAGRPRGKAIMIRQSGQAEGYLSEFVKTDPEFRNVLWYVFQDTLLMKDVKTARLNMGGVRMVTYDGDIFESSGAITGGYMDSRRETSGSREKLVGLTKRISELNEIISSIKTELTQLDTDFDAVTQELKEASRNEGREGADLHKIESDLNSSEIHLSEVSKRLNREKSALKELEASLAGLDRRFDEMSSNLKKLKAEKQRLYDIVGKISPEFLDRINTLEQERDRLLRIVSETETHLIRKQDELSACRSSIASKETDLSDSNENLESSRRRLKDLQAGIDEASQEIEKLKLMEQKLNANLKEYDDRIEAVGSTIAELNEEIRNAEFRIKSKNDTIVTINEKIYTNTKKLEESKENLMHGEGSPMDISLSNARIRAAINSLKAEIESLGPINHKAIEEYKSEFSRLKELEGKIDQLEREKEDVEQMMERLNNEKRKVFMGLFNDINHKMGEIYARLSSGGEARLVMSGSDDPLESEVYIQAKPKGKTLRKIDSLSGGEKSLTAISFILAVQKIKPSPVYYLDEIDMFLDGSNVEKIGRMFSENSRYAQIFLVSLKKAIIKYADQLIGVTTIDRKNTEIFTKGFPSNDRNAEHSVDSGDRGNGGRPV